MALRPPRQRSAAPHEPFTALAYEIAQEQATALGRLGRALERALAELAAFETDMPAAGTTRGALVRQASDALWHFIVQREACGLRDLRQVMRDYRVPIEVQVRIGAFAAKPGART